MKTLKFGSKGNDVKELQKALNGTKFRPRLKVDGKFGEKTQAAVRTWQKHSQIKPDGVADPKTLGSLVIFDKIEEYPFTAPDSIVVDAAKRRKEGRERMHKVMALAAKSKLDKMGYREKLMPKVWKKAEDCWRTLERPTKALIFAEGVFVSADGQDPRTKAKLLKDGKANLFRAKSALKDYNKAMDEVERIMVDMEEIARDEELYTPIPETAHKMLRQLKTWRKEQQDSVLQKMKVCNEYNRPEFEDLRRRYLKVEALLDKVFTGVWTHQEILGNQQEMYNKYIKTKPRAVLIDLRKRMERQTKKVDTLMGSWDAISERKYKLDDELSKMARQAA